MAFAAVMASFPATALAWWFHVAPYSWIVRLQLVILGEEWPKLTIVLCEVANLFLLAIAAKGLTSAGVLPRGRGHAVAPRYSRTALWSQGCLMAGVPALVIGVYLTCVVDDRPAAREVSLADIESGADRPGVELLRIRGVVVDEREVGVRDHTITRYLPLLPPGRTQESRVRVIVERTPPPTPTNLPSLNKPAPAPPPPGSEVEITGAVDVLGLPAVAIESFADAGTEVRGAIVIHEGGSMTAVVIVEQITLWLGGALTLAGGVLGGIALIRR